MPTVNFQFVNNTQLNSAASGLASSDIYLFLTQESLNLTWTINTSTGAASPNAPGTLPANSCTLAQLLTGAGAITIPASPTSSARIYFSNSANAVTISAGGAVSGPTAETADFYYDFIEFDLSSGILNIDTTQVDQLGIACNLQVTPADVNFPQGSGVVANLDRATLVSNFKAMATGNYSAFQDCVFVDAGLKFRLLSPSDVISSELAAQIYLCQATTSGGPGDWQTTITITGPGTGSQIPTNGALHIGMLVSGPFIPAGATISSVPGQPTGHTVTITSEAVDNPFVAFATSQSLAFFNPPATQLSTYFDDAIDDFFAYYKTNSNLLQIEQNISATDVVLTANVVQIDSISNIEGSTSTYTVLQFVGGGQTFNVFYPFFSTNSPAGKQTPFNVDVPPPPVWWTPNLGLMFYEPPSLMVFGASGVFADNTQQASVICSLNSAVLGAIENFIVTALARGSATTMQFLQGSITANSNSKTATVTLASGQTTADLTNDMFMFSFRIANIPMTPQLPATPSNTFTVTSPLDILPIPIDLLTFSQFYPVGGTWDAYANFLHNGTGSISIDGRAYALPFDDQGGFSSDLNSASTASAPASALITLNPWSPAPMICPLTDKKLVACNSISWENNSTASVSLSWVDLQGNEIPISTIAPGTQQSWGPAYFMGVNPVRDSQGNIVLVYVINASNTQTVSISQAAVSAALTRAQKNFPALQSLSNAPAVANFTVLNSSDVALDLFWIQPSGYWEKIQNIAAGLSLEVSNVCFGGAYVLRYQANIVSFFVASDTSEQTFCVTQALVDFWNN